MDWILIVMRFEYTQPVLTSELLRLIPVVSITILTFALARTAPLTVTPPSPSAAPLTLACLVSRCEVKGRSEPASSRS